MPGVALFTTQQIAHPNQARLDAWQLLSIVFHFPYTPFEEADSMNQCNKGNHTNHTNTEFTTLYG